MGPPGKLGEISHLEGPHDCIYKNRFGAHLVFDLG